MRIKKIYVNQPLRLTLDTKTDLATATTCRIRYKAPGGTPAFKTATVVGQTLTVDFLKNELNAPGDWEFRTWVEFGAGTGDVPGVPYIHIVGDV